MSANSTDQFISAIANVVSGWNEKLALTDDQLALMVPFCDLYAIYRGEDVPADVGEKNLVDQGIQVKLKDYSSKLDNVTLVPVFNLLEQQTSVDLQTGQLIRPRGVGGIDSCTISTINPDLGAYRITMQIQVPSFDQDVKINRSLRRLAIPGSDWLISYGWARDSSQGSKSFMPFVDNIVDLTATHKGYYRFLKSNLTRFNWEINTNRIVTGTLEFWPLQKAAGLLATMKVHRGTIKDLLTNESQLMANCRQNAPEIADQLPKDGVSILRQRTFDKKSGTSKVKVQKKEVGYYYLGWVIEAMRQSMDDPQNSKFIKHLKFEKFVDKKKSKVMNNADGNKEQTPLVCESPASIPIAVEDLYTEVIDLASNESILWSMDRVCYLANRQLIDTAEIFTELDADSHTFNVRDANDVAFNVANRTDAMEIAISAPNSLTQSIALGSRVPIDLTWNHNYFITTDEGTTNLYNMFAAEAASSKKDSDLSESAKLIRKFNRPISGSSNQKVLDANRSLSWRNYLAVNAKGKIPQITQEVVSSQTVPVGLALRNFFRTITVNIHGTAFIPPLTQINVEGILPGIDGRYQIFEFTDTLSPGSFVSEIQAALLLLA
jgi:hypothetical protein